MSKNASETESIEKMKSEMIRKFDALLRDVTSIDAAERDFMLSHLGQSLDDAIAEGASAFEGRALKDSVAGTVQLLQQEALLGPGDEAEVQGAFAPALDLVHSDRVNRALEFARIARESGEDAARNWLRGQTPEVLQERTDPGLIPTHVASAIGRSR